MPARRSAVQHRGGTDSVLQPANIYHYPPVCCSLSRPKVPPTTPPTCHCYYFHPHNCYSRMCEVICMCTDLNIEVIEHSTIKICAT